MGGKYEPLSRWLSSQVGDRVVTGFDQVAALVGGLPPSSGGRTWWGNSGKGQSVGWMSAGWIVEAVDLNDRVVTFGRGEVTTRRSNGTWGREVIMDGTASLEATLHRAGWPSVACAVAAHTIFLAPETVAQTRGRALFPVVRDPSRRGEFGDLADGRQVMFDDNTTPTDVFLWAAQRVRGPDVQFNHVWSGPSDPDSYTALWNLCCTPAFLAKASDTHPETVAALRRRAFELYGMTPAGQDPPSPPAEYASFEWGPMPAAVEDLEAVMRERMRSAPARRATIVAATLGWLYSDGPDTSLRSVAPGVS